MSTICIASKMAVKVFLRIVGCYILIYSVLDGFARVPYYAPSPCHMHPGHNCHMHPGHNCHHKKSCYPPDTQYTEFIITKYQWKVVGWFVNILFTGQCPPQDTSLEVSFPCSRPSSLNPSSVRFLPPAIHASSRPFLIRSLYQTSLPQPSLPPLMHSACLASSLPLSLPLLSPSIPPLVPSLPHHPLTPSLPLSLPCSIPPILLPFSLLACPPPCLPTARHPTQCTPCLCVWHAALYCVAPSHAGHWDNGIFIATAGVVWAGR